MENSGREPWQWLFLIEGVIAVAVGVLVVCLLPAFPDQMKNGKNWLFTKEDISLATRRTGSEFSEAEWAALG